MSHLEHLYVYLRKTGKAKVIYVQFVKGGLCYRAGHLAVRKS